MLKCNINQKKNRVKVKAKGTGKEIVVELLALIQDLYENMAEKNPEMAQKAKAAIICTLLDPDSPVWKEG